MVQCRRHHVLPLRVEKFYRFRVITSIERSDGQSLECMLPIDTRRVPGIWPSTGQEDERILSVTVTVSLARFLGGYTHEADYWTEKSP